MQRAFSAKMAATGDPAYSAEKAGYAVPVVAGNKLMHVPDVAEDVRRRARHQLMTKGAEVGVRVLIELAEDTKQKGSTRGAAAKSLVQLSGISSAAALSEADLAELPADKIRSLLAEAERALADRMAKMKTIDHEPAEKPESAQAAPNLFD
ncbi:hypothetical protein [Bradyrhizobium liaoningense]|uniref:hypothetical protein n=1 Tax=Bradyrhizobium liaoningense TaxID=43992 RepID=UPI00054FD78D|nr:hypothetical protein [Bradyrhizobium liaoningense]